ncbi:hypothetical protein D3C86_1614630 [compost metagenome]
MQNDEGAIDLLAHQAAEQVVADVDAKRIHACGLQRLEHGVAGLQGNFTLGALATEQHGDTTEIFRLNRRKQLIVGVNSHFTFPCVATAPANNGLFSNCGARPPISPAPWHRRMSPARSSGLTSGASSTPRSI